MRSSDWNDYDHCDKCWAGPSEPCWDMRTKMKQAKRPHRERMLKDLKTGAIIRVKRS